jgi:hypothetical protein
MNTQDTLPGLETLVKPFRFNSTPYVYKVVPLREAQTPDQMTLCDTPEAAAAYWRLHVPSGRDRVRVSWVFCGAEHIPVPGQIQVRRAW